ncbi:uncharacterized protein NECHADRAFT_52355 [Fusarium vanettenii 77-13-4]|uniref:Uncharacterized protein n=1 Tax=Fusarium vanettenii (strain ATCC MYA-4622 / CBS 123669 / FGSC 9596 / NRRL 45880 / 77-13-4) TaxID=660122 RepID=C7ZK16_FUSV7|nr:uncharacterized protein NECHADRAFT_52355 [Fusarium vanettenii 77-13-4]EEU35599.1 hypothetical protein NECHADRAFT_52355 [Fusarium vanettenii 77-13-4]
MTPFSQPSVPPLPSGIDLSGKTAIVTGATAGIGLEICRQLLNHKLSTLIMAVRNVSKGETTRQALLSDPAVKSSGHKATVKVMELNTENYSSVQNFASAFISSFQDLHLVMANAGIGTLHKELAISGHEKNMQVNYLSNVALTLALLPILEATATRTRAPTRVTWTGSRQYALTPLAGKIPLGKDEQVLKHIDTYDGIDTLGRYADSKVLCVLFQLELAKHYSPDKVIINSFCPGLVDTGMTDVLPFHIRAFMKVVKALSARSPEKAGWIALNAAVVAGAETHGKLLGDMTIDTPSDFVQSDEGQRIEKMLWNETVNEMGAIMAVPAWMKQ